LLLLSVDRAPCCHSAATARREEQEEQTQEVVEGRICCSGADPSLTGSLRQNGAFARKKRRRISVSALVHPGG